jgi:hypothetical protein
LALARKDMGDWTLGPRTASYPDRRSCHQEQRHELHARQQLGLRQVQLRVPDARQVVIFILVYFFGKLVFKRSFDNAINCLIFISIGVLKELLISYNGLLLHSIGVLRSFENAVNGLHLHAISEDIL